MFYLRAVITTLFLAMSVFGLSNESPAASGEKKEKVNIAELAFEHILDAHSWHLWGEGHAAVSMPLPVILHTQQGWVFFMSSEFHHDTQGQTVFESHGIRFTNFKETIYIASDSVQADGRFVSSKLINGKPVIQNAQPLDFSITKNAFQLILAMVLLLFLFIRMARAYSKHGIYTATRGSQSFLEPLVVFVRDDIAKTNIGPKSERFVPYLLTVFFLILINNIFGLIPIGANVTGNIAFTLVLAFITLVVTNINGNSHYWKHILLPKPLYLWPILMPIELVGIFTKPFALMIRLFANMSAGHIIVISLVGLVFVFESLWVSPISVAFALFIDVLECLVALLQAYIFTLLTALFIGSATADHHDAAHKDQDDQLLNPSH